MINGKLKSSIVLIFLFCITCSAIEDIRWCVVSESEYIKCKTLVNFLVKLTNLSSTYNVTCIPTKSSFNCMDQVYQRLADIVNLDVGLAYHAVQNYGMRMFAVENYNFMTDPSTMKLDYTSVAVVIAGTATSPIMLNGASLCSAGTGTAEGWIYPLSQLIKRNWMNITTCNNEVKIESSFFSNGSCAVNSENSIFNALGDNGNAACSKCTNTSDSRRYCTNSDPFAGSAGSMQCLEQLRLNNAVGVAFLRGDTLSNWVTNNPSIAGFYRLLCPTPQADGTFLNELSQTSTCNWGNPQSRMLMTQLSTNRIKVFQSFFENILSYFGPNGTNVASFNLFQSNIVFNLTADMVLLLGESGDTSAPQPLYDLMFSDATTNFYFPIDTLAVNFFQYINTDFEDAMNTLHRCPFPGVKWCVINDDEMQKCKNMKLALDSKMLRPEFYCVLGQSTTDCMRLISDGYADLITLDAAELYIGGKYLNLVPIAQEYYGDESNYYAVAIAKRADKGILISNWKYKRTCHSGAGKASGWIIPVNIAMETVQFRMYGDNLVYAFSELIARSCVPGILSSPYNPTGKNPINLCEICAAGGQDRCLPDTRENYYGDSGAFRCMLENGDIAFARHTTVHDNTDGRNTVDWARNRRSDDYELLCPDGTRVDTYSWKNCNLGKIPGHVVVTAGFKSQRQRDEIWRLLRYAQEYFSSDSNSVFTMFASPYGRNDLMFSDSAVSLKPIPAEKQNYSLILDRTFARQVENLELIGGKKKSGLFDTSSGSKTPAVLYVSIVVLSVFSCFLFSNF